MAADDDAQRTQEMRQQLREMHQQIRLLRRVTIALGVVEVIALAVYLLFRSHIRFLIE